jgi:hypothetical protein
MLSPEEHKDIKYKLDHIPDEIKGKTRRNLRAMYKKKLHEHFLASNFPPFQPLPYQQYFINHRTTELTLLHLIEAVASTKIFSLDTESVVVRGEQNKPTLIQLQIIFPNLFSYILFIEVWHLPRIHEQTFQLMKYLFYVLFNPENNIYIWGTSDELLKFLDFNLFSQEQIDLSNNINLQDKFKEHWNDKHPHRSSSSSSNDNTTCDCEQCLGIEVGNTWSLQNAMAYGLNVWLDKRWTISAFDIGLEPIPNHHNEKEIEYRELITKYAAYDCLAIQHVLIYLNIINKTQTISTQTINTTPDIELELDTAADEELQPELQ